MVFHQIVSPRCICYILFLYFYGSFKEAAKLRGIWWLEIRGKIHSMLLSQNSAYAAYMVFKLADDRYKKSYFPFQEASISVGGSESTRQTCLQGYMKVGDDEVHREHLLAASTRHYTLLHPHRSAVPLTDDIVLPQKRADGWMEVELGEFYNEEGDDGEVSTSLMETKGGLWKDGLVVWGIEIRAKK
jgi:hypothetical protein